MLYSVKSILPAASASFDNACQVSVKFNVSLAKTCFHIDCRETATLVVFSNMWHIHGIASIFKQPVMSINPDVNYRIRPFYNKPKENVANQCSSENSPMILWTRTCGMSDDSRHWSSNSAKSLFIVVFTINKVVLPLVCTL